MAGGAELLITRALAIGIALATFATGDMLNASKAAIAAPCSRFVIEPSPLLVPNSIFPIVRR
jgi:hypothetical protein